jgi:hypothetical protein
MKNNMEKKNMIMKEVLTENADASDIEEEE